MKYIAITQATAEWLISKNNLLDALHRALLKDQQALDLLKSADFVEGPFRLGGSADGETVALWNVDYLSGTGDDPWGFVVWDSHNGILGQPEISREVLERCLYVINQRLQGFLIDGTFIHRAYENGSHTCLSGRGSVARHFSIAYFERDVQSGSSTVHSIICVGPAHDFQDLSQLATKESGNLDRLTRVANNLISPNRKRSIMTIESLSELRRYLAPYVSPEDEYGQVSIPVATTQVEKAVAHRSVSLTFEDWIRSTSSLSEAQRRILSSDAIEKHPLRIMGPGGSGKTLLMQLLALRRLFIASEHGQKIRILYVVHNAAMAQTVQQRFHVLEGDSSLVHSDDRILDIFTLSEYGRQALGLEYSAIIDPDAHAAKQFQLEQVSQALRETMDQMPKQVSESAIFSQALNNVHIFPVIARLVMTEISTTIKGHGLENDKRRYEQSARPLSRLHGALSPQERAIVYNTYERYHRLVFEQFEVLDTDDIALSLLGRLRTPIWELKRKTLGYDYVFVDETQLFNENERRLFPLLTKGLGGHMPIILALDAAQDVFAQTSAGFATLGIKGIANENLTAIHRSTPAIVRLAFFIIQRSTDLFGPDFPDFTKIAKAAEPEDHPLALPPTIETASGDSRSIGEFVVNRLRTLRKSNLRQIGVICHAEQYWEGVLTALKQTELPLHVIEQRGERLPAGQPLVALGRPAHIGGQEFDAVILIGLEQGVVPPRVQDNDALSATVEQQSLREMYLSITRTKYRLIVVLSPGASPTSVIQEAQKQGLIRRAS